MHDDTSCTGPSLAKKNRVSNIALEPRAITPLLEAWPNHWAARGHSRAFVHKHDDGRVVEQFGVGA